MDTTVKYILIPFGFLFFLFVCLLLFLLHFISFDKTERNKIENKKIPKKESFCCCCCCCWCVFHQYSFRQQRQQHHFISGYLVCVCVCVGVILDRSGLFICSLYVCIICSHNIYSGPIFFFLLVPTLFPLQKFWLRIKNRCCCLFV